MRWSPAGWGERSLRNDVPDRFRQPVSRPNAVRILPCPRYGSFPSAGRAGERRQGQFGWTGRPGASRAKQEDAPCSARRRMGRRCNALPELRSRYRQVNPRRDSAGAGGEIAMDRDLADKTNAVSDRLLESGAEFGRRELAGDRADGRSTPDAPHPHPGRRRRHTRRRFAVRPAQPSGRGRIVAPGAPRRPARRPEGAFSGVPPSPRARTTASMIMEAPAWSSLWSRVSARKQSQYQ